MQGATRGIRHSDKKGNKTFSGLSCAGALGHACDAEGNKGDENYRLPFLFNETKEDRSDREEGLQTAWEVTVRLAFCLLRN